MVLSLFQYLRESWKLKYNPSIEKIKYDIQINDIKSESRFKDAILHLISRDFIRIESDSKGIKRILKGKYSLPKNYNYDQFWLEN